MWKPETAWTMNGHFPFSRKAVNAATELFPGLQYACCNCPEPLGESPWSYDYARTTKGSEREKREQRISCRTLGPDKNSTRPVLDSQYPRRFSCFFRGGAYMMLLVNQTENVFLAFRNSVSHAHAFFITVLISKYALEHNVTNVRITC